MRVGERLAQDPVDVADRLDRQSGSVAVEPALDEQLCVELVEVLGREALQRNGADAGHDVIDDIGLV